MIDNALKNKPANGDMPKFSQYPGACGLTSLLMVLKPESRKISPVLEELWIKIKKIFHFQSKTKGYNWQITIEWILFQVIFNTKLQQKLSKIFGKEFFISILPNLKDRILSKKPIFLSLDDDDSTFDSEAKYVNNLHGISREWVMRRVNVWKHDFELSIIASIFGCRFIPWKKTSDGTGAIFFTSKELKKGGESFNEKMQFLSSNVELGEPVLCCESIHWIAIKEIQKKKGDHLVYYHDPATADEYIRNLKGFREADRFYIYNFDQQLLNENIELIKSLPT